MSTAPTSTIDSVKDPLVQQVRALSSGAGRRREGRCVADGARLVTQLLQADATVDAVLVPSGTPPDPDLAVAAEAAGVAVHPVRPGVLRHALGTAIAPDCVAVCPLPRVADGGVPSARLAVVCDRVLDPGNLGSIVRTALALGPAAVVLTGDEDPGARRVLDASRGAVLRAELHRHPDALAAVRALRAAGWWVVTADGSSPTAMDDLAPGDGPIALVVGNETDGVSPSARRAADATGAIGIRGPVESLNVAVAAGIGLWMLGRHRPT